MQAACLARCNGASCELIFYKDVKEEEFRRQVEQHCLTPDKHIILSYNRQAFQQTGIQISLFKHIRELISTSGSTVLQHSEHMQPFTWARAV